MFLNRPTDSSFFSFFFFYVCFRVCKSLWTTLRTKVACNIAGERIGLFRMPFNRSLFFHMSFSYVCFHVYESIWTFFRTRVACNIGEESVRLVCVCVFVTAQDDLLKGIWDSYSLFSNFAHHTTHKSGAQYLRGESETLSYTFQ